MFFLDVVVREHSMVVFFWLWNGRIHCVVSVIVSDDLENRQNIVLPGSPHQKFRPGG